MPNHHHISSYFICSK